MPLIFFLGVILFPSLALANGLHIADTILGKEIQGLLPFGYLDVGRWPAGILSLTLRFSFLYVLFSVIYALDVRKRERESLIRQVSLPRWFRYVPAFFLLLVIVSAAHFAEHILQVIQKYLWEAPPFGIVGQVANREWLHIWYNLPIYLAILYIYFIIAKKNSKCGGTDAGFWYLKGFLWIQGYHVIEHVVKMYQYITTGIEPAPGILGNWVELVPLHFMLVAITFALMTIILFKSPFLGYAKWRKPVKT